MRISDWSSDVCFFRSKTPTPELRLIMTAFQAFAPIPQETTLNGSAGRLVLASDDEKILISGDIEIAANETGLAARSEAHTSELQSLMRISYAVFCLKKTKNIASQITKQHISKK